MKYRFNRVLMYRRFMLIWLLLLPVVGCVELKPVSTKAPAVATLITLVPPVTSTPIPTHTPTILPLTPTEVGGSVITNPPDGATYVYIPSGNYTIGATQDNIVAIERACLESGVIFAEEAYPRSRSHLSDGFWIKRTEVSNAEYMQCVEAGSCSEPAKPQWNDTQNLDYPVTHVTWNQAKTYAQWAGGDLPTMEEWEIACRGPEATIYPWGNEYPDATMANVKSSYMPGPEVVDSYPNSTSYYDILNMIGNVQEWTNTPHGTFRYVRGGSYDSNAAHWHCIYAGWLSPDLDKRQTDNGEVDEAKNEIDRATMGFRVVLSSP